MKLLINIIMIYNNTSLQISVRNLPDFFEKSLLPQKMKIPKNFDLMDGNFFIQAKIEKTSDLLDWS